MPKSVTQAVETVTATLAIIANGHRLPLISAVSLPNVEKGTKGGNTYWFLNYKGKTKKPWAGVAVPFLTEDGSLPDKVQLEVTQDGETKTVPVPLASGYTKPTDGSQGNLKSSRSGKFDIPFLGEKNLSINISAPKKTGGHNVIVDVYGVGGGGAKKVPTSFDDLF